MQFLIIHSAYNVCVCVYSFQLCLFVLIFQVIGTLNMTRYGRQTFAFLGSYDQQEKLTFLQRKNSEMQFLTSVSFIRLQLLRSAYLSWLWESEIENMALIYVCCHDLCTVKMNIRWFYALQRQESKQVDFILSSEDQDAETWLLNNVA